MNYEGKNHHRDDVSDSVDSEESNICVTDTSSEVKKVTETGGYEKSKEPTRYGDWEIAGRCIDF